jgi:hypothetical protein
MDAAGVLAAKVFTTSDFLAAVFPESVLAVDVAVTGFLLFEVAAGAAGDDFEGAGEDLADEDEDLEDAAFAAAVFVAAVFPATGLVLPGLADTIFVVAGLAAEALAAAALLNDALGAAVFVAVVLTADFAAAFVCAGAAAFTARMLAFAGPLTPALLFEPAWGLLTEVLPLDALAVRADVPAPAKWAFFIGADILGTPVKPRCGDGAKSRRKGARQGRTVRFFPQPRLCQNP